MIVDELIENPEPVSGFQIQKIIGLIFGVTTSFTH